MGSLRTLDSKDPSSNDSTAYMYRYRPSGIDKKVVNKTSYNTRSIQVQAIYKIETHRLIAEGWGSKISRLNWNKLANGGVVRLCLVQELVSRSERLVFVHVELDFERCLLRLL